MQPTCSRLQTMRRPTVYQYRKGESFTRNSGEEQLKQDWAEGGKGANGEKDAARCCHCCGFTCLVRFMRGIASAPKWASATDLALSQTSSVLPTEASS